MIFITVAWQLDKKQSSYLVHGMSNNSSILGGFLLRLADLLVVFAHLGLYIVLEYKLLYSACWTFHVVAGETIGDRPEIHWT